MLQYNRTKQKILKMKKLTYLFALLFVASVIFTACDNDEVTGVALNKSTLTLIVGENETLIATVTPDNANQSVLWISSDTGIVTVDNTGVVTAISEGTATITVVTADGGRTATCIVMVYECDDDVCPKEEIEAEKALINDFIRRQGIEITNRMPSDSEFLANPNLFYHSSSGLFYRLEQPSNRPDSDTIVPDDRLQIIARWIQYTLTTRPDTMDFRSPQAFPHGFSFAFPEPSTAPPAFLEAVRYMRGSGARARLIVPHHIGFNPTVVTPYGFDIEISFRRD